MLSLTDHSDLKSTRRALYLASFVTFAVANADFLSNEVSIFGLTFVLNQPDLVALGRFSTLITFFVFLLHAFSGLTKLWVNRAERIFELQQKKLDEEMSEIHSEVYGDGYAPGPEAESWDLYYKEATNRI